MKTEKVEHYCDRCGKKLKTYSNNLCITTDLNEGFFWDRLKVKIERHHGVHNNVNVKQADLCKKCVLFLLTNAIERVKAGERMSKGEISSEKLGFDQTTAFSMGEHDKGQI